MMTKKCLRCGKEWVNRVENPRTCPACKSPYWNVPRRTKRGGNK